MGQLRYSMNRPVVRSSEMDCVLSCPGSLTLTRLVNKRDGDEGFEGVAIHHAIATRAIRELGATPPEGGLPPPQVPPGYKIPTHSLWIVDWAIRHIQEVIPADWSLMVEVEMEFEFGRWVNQGHADVIGISPCGTKAKQIDWKAVRIPVDPADNNEQVCSYLSLAKLSWPSLTEAEGQICQPRVSEEDGVERVSRVTVTDLDAMIASMDRRICTALDNAMCLKTGKQCTYCIGCSCPAIQAEQEYMDLMLTPEILAKIKRTPDDALLGDFVIIGRRLAKPIKDATEMIHERLDRVGYVDAGCGSRITRETRCGAYSWPDPLAAFKAVKELLPSDESLAKVMTPSVTRIKDEIAEIMKIPKTGASAVTSEGIFDAKLRPLCEQGVSNLLKY